MSNSNTTNSLSKVDAAEGFVEYTNTVKPYHSKILDVLIEYVYSEDIKVKVTESWNTEINQEKSAGTNCYFQITDALTNPGLGGDFYIQGHHTDKFKPGDRFLVTYANNTSKTFIVAASSIVPIIELTDPKLTKVTVYVKQTVPSTTTKHAQLAYAPNYRLMGSLPNALVVDGNAIDEFMPGEQIMVGGTRIGSIDARVFTISGTPTLGRYSADNIGSGSKFSPTYNIVGFKPTTISGASNIVNGVWVILGNHAANFRSGGILCVTNSANTSIYYSVQSAQAVTLSSLPAGYVLHDNQQYLNNDIVTLVTVQNNHEISASAEPSGTMKYPAAPVYNIIGKTTTAWIIDGWYEEWFTANDRFTVTGNGYTQANTEYVISSATNSTDEPFTTTVKVVGTIPTSATSTGVISHPTELSTIIPVKESVFEFTPEYGTVYKQYGSGTLRYLPLVIQQITQPTTAVIGAVWIHPVTNASMRWDGTRWIHNYTPTYHSWYNDAVSPSRVVVKSSVGQITDKTNANYTKSNSFLVDTTSALSSATFSVTNLQSNQLMFAKSYTIVGVEPLLNTWVAKGRVVITPGESLYITSSSNAQGLGKYTVLETPVYDAVTNTTRIVVTKQISRLASADGVLSVPTDIGYIPKWVEGTKVTVTSTGTMPSPLLKNNTYYFIPVSKPYANSNTQTVAMFALSKVRKPRNWFDYVDVTTFGSGVLTVKQDEVYVPGTHITIKDSYISRNNGGYTVNRVKQESSTTQRVYVNEHVPSTTPTGVANDGVMLYNIDSHMFSSLTSRPCPSREQSELNVAASVTEFIQFEFNISEFDFVTAGVTENEPVESYMHDLGFDSPNDVGGYDGDIELVSSLMMYGVYGNAYAHSMVPVGFDTQYFDVGGIDETTETLAKKYGRSV